VFSIRTRLNMRENAKNRKSFPLLWLRDMASVVSSLRQVLLWVAANIKFRERKGSLAATEAS
jgi:hypothetical protein